MHATMEFITSIPRSNNGNNSILTVVNISINVIRNLSKKPKTDSSLPAGLFKNFVNSNTRILMKIFCDRDYFFTSEFLKSLLHLRDTKVSSSFGYHRKNIYIAGQK